MAKRPHNHAPPARPSVVGEAIERAQMAMRMQRPDQAERIAAEVLKSDRGNIRAAQILGHSLMMQNRAAEAIGPLERAARRSGDPEVETQFAVALAAAGRQDDAFEQLSRTTARRPPFPQAFVVQACQLAAVHRVDEGIGVLEQALSLTPHVNELRLHLGRLLLARNDRAKARAVLSDALELSPDNLDLMSELGRVMHFDGDYAAAAGMYKRVLVRQPENTAIRTALAACMLELGDRGAAEACLRTSARSDPASVGRAIAVLASASHGRFFLQPSRAERFLRSQA